VRRAGIWSRTVGGSRAVRIIHVVRRGVQIAGRPPPSAGTGREVSLPSPAPAVGRSRQCTRPIAATSCESLLPKKHGCAYSSPSRCPPLTTGNPIREPNTVSEHWRTAIRGSGFRLHAVSTRGTGLRVPPASRRLEYQRQSSGR
jgi:hypothetical protein